ncbi:MAG: hypothetical protein KDB21_17700, partial [Acidimicrobiales bacterium]|nr:hypothetical protein [Acidimicrobiales bacterium]
NWRGSINAMGDREDAERERRYAAMAEAMRWTSMGSGQRPPLEQPADGVGWPVERDGELATDVHPRDRCAVEVGGDAVAAPTRSWSVRRLAPAHPDWFSYRST